ncbi:MAG: hypothetical protein AAGE93_22355 [Bacteroidota bacterium]
METQPFYKSKLESASLWGKLRGQKLEKNAVLEINNLLSEKPILAITPTEVQAITDKYQLNLYTDFTDGSLREMYKSYLRYCFDDNHLDEEEIGRLKHLKRLLGLTDKDIDLAHHRICQEMYERELESALHDNRLDEKELRFLRYLQTKLQLPAEVASRISPHKAKSIITEFIIGAISDEPLSPDEARELATLIVHWDTKSSKVSPTHASLAKYRLLWQLENGELPTLHVPLQLSEEERCYFLTNATWHDASGKVLITNPVPLRTKLAESNFWQPAEGSLLSKVSITETSEGKVYLTGERLIYRENEQEKIIPLTDILNFQPYSDGLAILREKSRHIVLATDKADVFSMILGRVLRDKKV